MRPRVLLVAALVVTAVACSSSPPDPYAAYRQTQTEDVPGTLDWQIGPVPDGYRPSIGPADAYDELFTAGDRKHAYAILAQVTNTTDHSVGPPAWVFVTPHTCYASRISTSARRRSRPRPVRSPNSSPIAAQSCPTCPTSPRWPSRTAITTR